MDPSSRLGKSSNYVNELDSRNGETVSGSMPSNQKVPVLSKREINAERLLEPTAEQIAYKENFGELVLHGVLYNSRAGERNNETVTLESFKRAVISLLHMQESEQENAADTLLGILTARVESYTRKASVMGSNGSKEFQTTRLMVGVLKLLVESENLGLGKVSHTKIKDALPALESQAKVEYEVRNDKIKGLHTVIAEPKM
ncbi:hypothetical protein ABC383_11515 [Noviherbaspirillum sp. 1P10PC]|uniref:hypothetical protein n=1 Tax=Noviherbaspirillum sp. 1P10PC TaxID=3132292 RepID=UPI0039A22C87